MTAFEVPTATAVAMDTKPSDVTNKDEALGLERYVLVSVFQPTSNMNSLFSLSSFISLSPFLSLFSLSDLYLISISSLSSLSLFLSLFLSLSLSFSLSLFLSLSSLTVFRPRSRGQKVTTNQINYIRSVLIPKLRHHDASW